MQSSSTTTAGKLTSEQLTFLFQQRMSDPNQWTNEKIATYFQLPSHSVENLLKFYSDFNVQETPKIPEPLADITY